MMCITQTALGSAALIFLICMTASIQLWLAVVITCCHGIFIILLDYGLRRQLWRLEVFYPKRATFVHLGGGQRV